MAQGRFGFLVAADSSDVWGWNGWLVDRQAKVKYPLVKTVVDYVVDDEIGYATCAFDTKEEMRKAALRKARQIERVAA